MESKIQAMILAEEEYLREEKKKRVRAGFFARELNTFSYQEQHALFKDYLIEEWQWNMLHKLRDTISDKLFIGEKAAMISGIFVRQTLRVDDYGGFAIREPFGEAAFSHVATFSEHVVRTRSGNRTHKAICQDEKGILIYFPGVYKYPAKEVLIVHTNKLTDRNEIRESIGLPKQRANLMGEFLQGMANELKGNGDRLELPNSPFARKFRHHFEIQCKDAALAGHILTDAQMQDLLTLRKAMGKGISVSYIGADIYLFIHDCDAYIRAWSGKKDLGIDGEDVNRMNMILNHTQDLLALLLPKEEM